MLISCLHRHTSCAKVLFMKSFIHALFAVLLMFSPVFAGEAPKEVPPETPSEAKPAAIVEKPESPEPAAADEPPAEEAVAEKPPVVVAPSPEKLAMMRYQPIIDRKPFGAPPPIPPPGPDPNPEDQIPRSSELRSLEVCAFTKADNGTLTVGLLNSKGNAVYYLGIGETSYDGEFTVIGADFEKEGVQVRQDSYERWIYNASQPSRSSASSSSGSSSLRSRSDSIRNTREAILERMRKRRSASQSKAKTTHYSQEQLQNQLTPEQMKQHLQKVQMDTIRAGGEKGPPLPVPLTVESDNQLVNEGVLPPR